MNYFHTSWTVFCEQNHSTPTFAAPKPPYHLSLYIYMVTATASFVSYASYPTSAQRFVSYASAPPPAAPSTSTAPNTSSKPPTAQLTTSTAPTTSSMDRGAEKAKQTPVARAAQVKVKMVKSNKLTSKQKNREMISTIPVIGSGYGKSWAVWP